MTDPIMEEVYAARRHLWERGGGTMHGVCEYLRKHRVERLAKAAAEAACTGTAPAKRRPGGRVPTRRGNAIARKGRKENEETAK
jgi:hypothetical protein